MILKPYNVPNAAQLQLIVSSNRKKFHTKRRTVRTPHSHHLSCESLPLPYVTLDGVIASYIYFSLYRIGKLLRNHYHYGNRFENKTYTSVWALLLLIGVHEPRNLFRTVSFVCSESGWAWENSAFYTFVKENFNQQCEIGNFGDEQENFIFNKKNLWSTAIEVKSHSLAVER